MLGATDAIAPTGKIRSYLEDAEHLEVMWNDSLGHAEFLLSPKAQEELVRRIVTRGKKRDN